MCNKLKHKEYAGAIKHIQHLKEKFGGEYAAYYHPGCNAYHVTSHVRGNNKFLKFKG